MERDTTKQNGTKPTAGGPSNDRAETLHHQIRSELHDRISNGIYGPGATLPGEQELARQFKVSRITVKRALNDLALAGFVRRQRGRGTFVTFGASHPVVKGSFSTLLHSLKAMGVETQVELISAEKIGANDSIAQLLDLKEGDIVQRAKRMRRLEGEPFSYLITHVPADIAEHYESAELAEIPLLTLLERSGVEVTDAEQIFSAVSATKEIADALEISTGAPLLQITRIMRNKNKRPVQIIDAHYRPDKFQYHMRLTRHREDGEDVWTDLD